MKEHQVRIVRYDNIVVIVKILKTIYRLKEIVLESVHFLIIEYIDGKMGRAHFPGHINNVVLQTYYHK